MTSGLRARTGASPVLRLPSVRALWIQCASLVLIWLLLRCAGLFASFKVDLFVVAALQGLFAACASRWLGLAPWWLVIQLLFPPLILLTLSLRLPPAVFLLAFLFFVVLYWSCFRTQVPYYPSRRFAGQALLQQLPSNPGLRIIDIGSGLGGLVLHLAQMRSDSEVIGIELAPLPWFISYCRARFGRRPAQFLRGDYQALDFSRFDVVFAYLSPAAMSRLWCKAKAEMRGGSMLFSYEFLIAEQGPDVTIPDPDGGPALYGWRF